MATQTYTFAATSQNVVAGPLSLTTAESTYVFTLPTTGVPGVWAVQFIADAAFLYSNATGGNFFPVAASTGLTLEIRSTQTLYFKAVSTATLSALVTDVRSS